MCFFNYNKITNQQYVLKLRTPFLTKQKKPYTKYKVLKYFLILILSN
jgi:hypothetical protein